MPISNSWLNQGVNAILSGIQELELNASGGGGSRRYRYVVSARIKIPAKTWVTIIPGTAEPVSREISVYLIYGAAVSLKWQGMTQDDYSLLQLNSKSPEYRDNADGGIRLKGFSDIGDCEVAVIIRQEEPITYKLGGNKVTNVSVSLWVQSDKSYSQEISDYDIAQMVDNFTYSDDGVFGYKVFFINSFTPGEAITFNIDASSAGYGGSKVEMQLIKPLEMLSLLFHIGISNSLWYDLPDFVRGYSGLSTVFTYGGKTESASGGELKVKPRFDLLAGRFVARNSFSESSDTCIITDYQPNVDNPEQGGTFTLGGF
ncbi:MAG: hypothetical protein F6K24_02405 [Okeania sp. SIO2D1]|nr:hypothetical protein [Okeania sp. SIO2D1]